MKIAGLVDALNLLTDLPFTEWAWSEAPTDGYGVVTADGQSELKADADPAAEKMLTGYVDVFIKATDPDPTEDVEDAMRAIGVWFRMESIQFEPETGFIHIEWRYTDTMNNTKKAILNTLPLVLHITRTEEVVTEHHTYRNVIFADGETDLIYQNAWTSDMYVEMPLWGQPEGVTVSIPLRKSFVKRDANGTVVIDFDGYNPLLSGSDETATLNKLRGCKLAVFFASDGTFHSAVATEYERTME